MSEENGTTSVVEAVEAQEAAPAAKVTPKPGSKPKAAPAAKAKPAAKASAKPAAPKGKPAAAKEDGPTIREQVFKLLSKNPMTGPAIKDKLGIGGVPSFLKDEGVCDKPRIRRKVEEGVRGVVYELTALGRKDLEAGKVNDNAAAPSGGKDWPQGR